MKKIGIIGAGNMGEALIKGLVETRLIASLQFVSDVSKERLRFLQKKYRVSIVTSNVELVKKSDIIILAVKPQNIDAVILEIKDVVNVGARSSVPLLVISIAAGIKTALIEKRVGKVAVVRAMPNIPALVQKGISAFCCGKSVKNAHKEAVIGILSSIGEVVEVKEDMMDAVTAISGSGPAYFFFLMEELARIGVKEGLNKDIAEKLAVQTALGAAELARQAKSGPQELRARVTSKGGTTEAAFKIFKKEGLGKILEKGVKAAIKRSRELSCLY